MTKEEIARVEALVNESILLAEAASTVVTTPDAARAMGAMALFGEKYGDTVRVVKIGHTSTELCGGTHVSSTGEIGLFKIISETGVAAGIRRIEGVTGLSVLKLLAERDALIAETARELKVQDQSGIAKKAQSLQAELKETKRQLESANSKISEMKAQSLLNDVRDLGAFKLLTAKLNARPDEARALCDTFKSRFANGVAVFAAVSGDKLNFVAACGAEAVKAGAHAGKLLSEISAICGGKGGGRPDSAMSGGKDLSKIDEALSAVEKLLGSK
jgi:alanyl-tRNA synthetase